MSTLAGQQQHRPQAEQAMLAQQSAKMIEQQGQRLMQTESPAKGEIRDREKQGSGQQRGQGKKRSGSSAAQHESRAEHPFKGKHIDYIG
jgi:hypothetical protein